MIEAYARLDEDPELWVGVLHAWGDHFTAGLELARFADNMQRGIRCGDRTRKVDPTALGRACRKPVVCAVRGITYTLGIELILAGDIVVASEDCRFSQLEPLRGSSHRFGARSRSRRHRTRPCFEDRGQDLQGAPLVATDDFREGVDSFVERRDLTFPGH